MLQHHIQTKIVEYLAANPGASYGNMRPEGVESNAFSYHLKLLMKEDLVKKKDDGTYRLTAIGGMISHKPNKSIADRVKRAYSVIFFVLMDDKGRWLVRRRLYPPLHDYLETVLGHPKDTGPVAEIASESFEASTGIKAEFRVIGSALIRVLSNDELLSYKNVLVVRADSYSGKLSREAIDQQCSWMTKKEILDTPKLAPHMKDLFDLVEKGDLFWEELRYDIPDLEP